MANPDYPVRIGLERALEIVAACAAQHRMPIETAALADAQWRILAEPIRAPHPLPPFANSAMDGFALRGRDLPAEGKRAFALVGEVFAGAASAPAIGAGECVRITTGAPMPAGADTVVVKENATLVDGHVTLDAGEKAGANVRAAGEDYAEGDLACEAGTRLDAARLAVLAALGIAEVPVRRKPRIAVIATGDELVQAGQALGFGQIHESNAVMLAALSRESGLQVVVQNRVRDDPDALRAALPEAAADADIIVTSGGVSAGEADHLPRVLASIGETCFHKVRLKPGMPTLFGRIGACLYFGLPGNPVASAVTFRVFVGFAVRAMLGVGTVPVPDRARLDAPLRKRHARAEFLRCRLHRDDDGIQWAVPHAKQGSGMLRGLAESDALALLPEGEMEYQRGDIVMLWPG
ncbi:MAG: molybdopterin molybdotransferase MoeA [Rhodanobacteraceae bacterium]